MFVNPLTAIKEGWVTSKNLPSLSSWEENNHVSPNAIDFTIDTLYTINPDNHFRIDSESKDMRGGYRVVDNFDPQYKKHYWRLAPKQSYDFMSDFYVQLPEGIAALLIIRSTFNRNGLFLTSGLYDSGFKGHIAGALHNMVGLSFIERGTRLGQIMFVDSGTAKTYAGGYNHESGTHHAEKE